MSQSQSELLAAWLIAAVCIGAVTLWQETVPDAQAVSRIDSSSRSIARGVPWASSRDLMLQRPEAEEDSPIMP